MQVVAPIITETTTRLASTTSGNGAEQKIITTSAPAPPVSLPLPAPCASPCGSPQAGAELILNPNAPAAALGAPALALGSPALGASSLPFGAAALNAAALPLGAASFGNAYGNPGALGLALGGPAYGQSFDDLSTLARLCDLNGFAFPSGNPTYF